MTAQSIPCPSEFLLERLRHGEVERTPAQAGHLASCDSCRARLGELDAPPPPLDLRNVREAAQDRPLLPGWLFQWRWLPLVGVSAALVLVFALRRPDTLIKGGAPFTLSIIARTPDGTVQRVDPGARLRGGDQLRFEVATTWPRAEVALISLDGRGVVSPLVPAAGNTAAISGGQRVLLEGAVELEDNVGPERVVLVACERPMAVAAVLDAARAALARAGGDPRRVTELGTGCHEESIWMEKVSR
jgi:hypothetical protein